jgi:Alkaline phosphatase
MIRLNKRIITALLTIVLAASTILMVATTSAEQLSTTNNSYSGSAPKYVFLFIGDGMSYSQIYAAEAYKGKSVSPDKVGISKMNFTNFPVAGSATTYDSSSICPDSASTATSISTGNKTLSGVINMDTTKTIKFKTITEMAKAKGYKIGIVSSVSINHATPAAFYAHQPTRSNYYDIGLELAGSGFDYFGGGGFLQQKGAKNDQKDIYDVAKEKGYKIANTSKDILALTSNSSKVIATNEALDSEMALPYEIDRSSGDLSLADFTRKGIDVLNNNKGFFMMVEGGKIDWTCHANDAATEIHDTIAFENAVNEAIKFYDKHPKETLIIVTADHETGGLTIGFAGTGYSTFFDKLSYQKESYLEFDNKVKLYVNNTTASNAKLEDMLPEIKESFGLIVSTDADASKRPEMVLTEYEVQKLRDALAQSLVPSSDRKYSDGEKLLYGTYEPLSVTITHILDNKAGIAWTSYAHTGVPVPVFAKGSGQDLFNGYYDNTDIFKKLTSILKIK